MIRALRQTHYVGRKRLKPGLRTIAGLLLIVGGVLGFLPILGFWMAPLGLFLIALDIPGTRGALARWLNRQKHRQNGDAPEDPSAKN